MATRERIIEEARTWLGTPFQHQQSVKGIGVDCVNFIASVAHQTGATEDVEFERNYRPREDGTVMLRLLRDYTERVETAEDAMPGDVVALCSEDMRHPEIPRHLVVLTQTDPHWKAIHASEHGVREHRMSLPFMRRIHSIWRIKTIE